MAFSCHLSLHELKEMESEAEEGHGAEPAPAASAAPAAERRCRVDARARQLQRGAEQMRRRRRAKRDASLVGGRPGVPVNVKHRCPGSPAPSHPSVLAGLAFGGPGVRPSQPSGARRRLRAVASQTNPYCNFMRQVLQLAHRRHSSQKQHFRECAALWRLQFPSTPASRRDRCPRKSIVLLDKAAKVAKTEAAAKARSANLQKARAEKKKKREEQESGVGTPAASPVSCCATQSLR